MLQILIFSRFFKLEMAISLDIKFLSYFKIGVQKFSLALSTSSVVLLRKYSNFPSLSLVIHYLVLYSSSCCLHCTFSTSLVDWSFEKGDASFWYQVMMTIFRGCIPFSGSFQNLPFKCLNPKNLDSAQYPISF